MITKHSARSKRQIRQICFVVMIALLLSGLGIGTGAAQAPPIEDPQAALLDEAGLLTDLDLSQTIQFHIEDGDPQTVTITLHWIYADIAQVVVGYTIDGLDSVDPVDDDAVFYLPELKLHDAVGNEFFSGGGGAGTVRFGFTQFRTAGDPVTIGEDYLSSLYGDDLPDELELIVGIELMRMTPSMSIYEPLPDAAAEFAIAVPLQPGIELAPMLTDTQQDITAILETLRITPTQTEARICYDLPDNRDWQPQATLWIDDAFGLLTGWGMTSLPTPEDVSRCFDMTFDLLQLTEPVQATLKLERLQLSAPESPEFWEDVRDDLVPLGIEIEVHPQPHVPYQIVSAPAGMDEAVQWQTIQAVIDDLLPTIEGPWVFTVDFHN